MFEGAGKQAGILIWRIENFEPVALPKADYGKFYNGDCYIVLNSINESGSSSLDHYLYFWLGKDSSQDERGAAAIQTVTLDNDCLGGSAVQAREVQGHESAAFLGLFPKPQFLKGGVASGFHSVESEQFEPRMFHLKGARQVVMRQVDVSAKSMNSGDVFILELQDEIFQWNGSKSNMREKSKGVDVSMQLRDEMHGGRALVTVIDEGKEPAEFWAPLGGKQRIANAVSDDLKADKTYAPRLFKCSDSTGELKTTPVKSTGTLLSKSLLDSKDVFIVDCGSELFVWVGSQASDGERAGALDTANKFLASAKRPAWTQAKRVVDGGEPPSFKAKFSDFFTPAPPPDFRNASNRNTNIAKSGTPRKSGEIAQNLVANSPSTGASPRAQPVDDGNGTAKVWRIHNFGKEEVPPAEFGQFYEGDSYIVHYAYDQRGTEMHIIYFWQGRKSTADEKGTSAFLAKEIDDALGGKATQVRLEQGHETQHFLRVFKGKLVVRFGGHESGFRTRDEGADEETLAGDGIQLYHVKGYGSLDSCYGVQVDAEAGSLNSGDAFVLVAPAEVTVWRGGGASEPEKHVAARVASALAAGRPIREADEGREPDAFWSALGGKGDYVTTKVPMAGDAPPRLFECSNRTGVFDVEEIFGFAQQDLLTAEAYLLDINSTLFVWLGAKCNAEEQERSRDVARDYLKAAGRPQTPLVVVKEGQEPALFTANFRGWDHDKPATFEDPYEAKLQKLQAKNAQMPAPAWADKAKAKTASAADRVRASGDGLASPGGGSPAVKVSGASKGGTPRSPGGGGSENNWLPPNGLRPAPTKPADVGVEKALTVRPDPADFAEPGTIAVSLDEIKTNSNPKVDPARKELYLTDADFKKVLGCTKEEWAKMKAWRQVDVKKKVGIF